MRLVRYFLGKLAFWAGVSLFILEVLAPMFGELAAIGATVAFLGWLAIPDVRRRGDG